MTDETIRGHGDQMSGDRVLAATGRTPEEWYAVLDERGATTWGHSAIAAWVLEQGVDGWWAQGVTIGYEQARGLRIPGQRSDGTFAVSASRTVSGDPDPVLDAAIALFSETFAPTSESRKAKRRYARWTFPDRESVLVTTEPAAAGKARVSAERGRLAGPERIPDAKAELQELVARL
jgi:hypothetical protein